MSIIASHGGRLGYVGSEKLSASGDALLVSVCDCGDDSNLTRGQDLPSIFRSAPRRWKTRERAFKSWGCLYQNEYASFIWTKDSSSDPMSSHSVPLTSQRVAAPTPSDWRTENDY